VLSLPSWLRPLLRSAFWTPVRADTALALGFFIVQVLLWFASASDWGNHNKLSPLWAAVTLAPVVVRRVWLWPAVGVTGAFIAIGMFYLPFWTSQGAALWVMAYTLAAYERWWRAMLGSVGLWLVNDLALLSAVDQGWLRGPDGQQLISLSAAMLVNVVMMVVIFLIGRTMRARREAAQALAERAAAAEQGRQAHAEQAVAEERRRIARELHDVVAHHVSVIGVMATGARRMLKLDPDAAEQALGTIEQTSRTTLRELRRLLFLLRVENESDTQLTPQPGLDGIRLLIGQVCEAGLPASMRVEGEPGELDPGVALTAYRIVQEALTNTLKHGGQATAEVRMGFEPRLLTIEVFDNGLGPRGAVSPGHGLLGMRERVAVYGGTLRTGPRPGGGFRVYARIPLEAQDQVEAVS
jgi:signal transduction histidine kinase